MKEIVVISGKGGTGKTSVMASLAYCAEKSVLADCDVDAADLHLLLQPDNQKTEDFISGVAPELNPDQCIQCGKCIDVCVFNAISEEFKIQPFDCEGCGVCAHFCPADAIELRRRHCGEWYQSETRLGPMVYARLFPAEENSGKLITLLRKTARDLAQKEGLELILIDGSPGIGCPVISSVTNADFLVIVTEPSVSGIHDLQRVCDLIDHFGLKAGIVINKANLDEIMKQRIYDLSAEIKVPVIGELPYDLVFTQAMVQGKILMEFSEGGISEKIKAIYKQIMHQLKD